MQGPKGKSEHDPSGGRSEGRISCAFSVLVHTTQWYAYSMNGNFKPDVF